MKNFPPTFKIMQSIPSIKRGFTLLELLVVISIIGLLATVILAALGSSRAKAADGAVKANLKNAITQAQVYYDLGGDTYVGVCALTGTRVIGSMVKSAENNYDGQLSIYDGLTASTWDNAQCHDNLTAWAAWVPLRASANGAVVAWCTDSTGASRKVTAVLPGGGVAAAYVCP